MQRAEGPKAFELGYQKMLNEFQNDAPRLEYIQELFRDENKAYFKQILRFSNAVLVDVCEILFSAVKTWVIGSSKKGTSLFLAVVRIVEGCRGLMNRCFVKKVELTKKRILKKTNNMVLVGLFDYLSEHLTSFAVTEMYGLLDKIWNRYSLTHGGTNDTMMVSLK